MQNYCIVCYYIKFFTQTHIKRCEISHLGVRIPQANQTTNLNISLISQCKKIDMEIKTYFIYPYAKWKVCTAARSKKHFLRAL